VVYTGLLVLACLVGAAACCWAVISLFRGQA